MHRRTGQPPDPGHRPVHQFGHVVLDDDAVVAASRSNLRASRLIGRAHAEAGLHLYALA